MRRAPLLAPSLLCLWTPAPASQLQRTLESRWRGAWVVTTVETRSDCSVGWTGNRVDGLLVSSSGRVRFPAGEIAQVGDVDLKRSRLELRLSLNEPVLLSRQDGPFTLYDEGRCRMEVQVEVPRELVSGDNLMGIEAAVQKVLKRYVSLDEAKKSPAWNRRERDPYPKDYEQTLARYSAWKASQVNATIKARIDKALEETGRITDRLIGDPNYLAGFAAGVEQMRSVNLGECGEMLARSFGNYSGGAAPANRSEAQMRHDRGYEDGQRLVYGVELLRRLPGCYVTVPGPPPPGASGGQP